MVGVWGWGGGLVGCVCVGECVVVGVWGCGGVWVCVWVCVCVGVWWCGVGGVWGVCV